MSLEVGRQLFQNLTQTPQGKEKLKNATDQYRKELNDTEGYITLISNKAHITYNFEQKRFVDFPTDEMDNTLVFRAQKSELIKRVHTFVLSLFPVKEDAENAEKYLFSRAISGSSYENFISSDTPPAEIFLADKELMGVINQLEKSITYVELLKERIQKGQEQLATYRKEAKTLENLILWPETQEIEELLPKLQKEFKNPQNEALRKSLIEILNCIKAKNLNKLPWTELSKLNNPNLNDILENDALGKLHRIKEKLAIYFRTLNAIHDWEEEIKKLQESLEKENPSIQPNVETNIPNQIVDISALNEPIAVPKKEEQIQPTTDNSIIQEQQPTVKTPPKVEPVSLSSAETTKVKNPPTEIQETPNILQDQLPQNKAPEKQKKTWSARLLKILAFPFFKLRDFFSWLIKKIFK